MDSLLVISMAHSNSIFSLIFNVGFMLSEGPDSKASYNTLMNVVKTIDLQANRIKLTFNFNPLSWHYYSFKLHQGRYVLTISSFFHLQPQRSIGSSRVHWLCVRQTRRLLRSSMARQNTCLIL